MTAETLPATKTAKKRRPITCRCCGKSRRHRGRRLCDSCWTRSAKLGHPDVVPPPTSPAEQARLLNMQRAAERRDRVDRPTTGWDWQDDAACRDEDTILFFGPDGERSAERTIREAKAKKVCSRCPVRGECLSYAANRPEKHGTWGGLNEDERAGERRRRMRRANAA